MENDACVEQKSGDNPAVDQVKQQPVSTAPYRYSKVKRNAVAWWSQKYWHFLNWVNRFAMQEELLEIKELPVSNERPECLSVKYDR